MAKKKSAKKSTSSKPAKKSAVKAKPKAHAKKAAAKPAKKEAAKSAPKAKASAKKSSAKVSAKKAAPKSTVKPTRKTMATPPSKAAPKRSINLASIFTPLDDRVVVEQAEASERTAGGLYIPDTAQNMDHYKEGRVVAVGRGHFSKKGFLRPLDVKVGDQVVFTSYAGREIQVQEQSYLVITEADILGIRD